jgi:hypothetical protein
MQPNTNNNYPQGAPQQPGSDQQPGFSPQPQIPQPQVPPVQPQQPWGQDSFYGQPQGPLPVQPVMPPPQPLPTAPHSPSGPVALTLPIWIREHIVVLIASIIGIIIILTIAGQIIYPSSHLLPGTKVDGVDLSWMRKQDAAKKLDGLYGDLKLAIYFGKNDAAFQTPAFKDVGIGTDNSARLDSLQYPWYLRIIPSSIFWAAGLSKVASAPDYTYDKAKIDAYTQSKVGDDCTIPAQDASLKLVEDKLQVVPAVPGGICDITKFQQVLATTKPVAGPDNSIRIDVQETPAMVDDDKAKLLADALNDRMSTPMPINVVGAQQTVIGRSVLSWLDFKSFIPQLPAGQNDPDKIRDGSKLTFTVNRDRMSKYMAGDISPKVAIKAGVTRISTSDFTETSHVNGQTGRELDPDKTAIDVENYLNKKAVQAAAETRPVAPQIVYTRTYSPTNTGFAALLSQYPQEHAGTYAASMLELSGAQPYRSANYRGDQPMITAGSEAGYVGYAVVMAEANGTMLSSDKIVGSRQTDQCFKDMIERTDTDCSLAFMNKIGHETLVARGKELGLTGTIFAAAQTKTTTNDLLNFLIQVYRSQVAPNVGGGRILSAMQTTRLRDGLQAGLGKGNVTNIAGEGGTVHNDAGIMFSTKGVYVLTIMTDGASRADIAALASKVEALHQVSPPKK